MLKLALRHLLAHPARSILTALSVAVAVCLLLILRASVVGLQSAVTNASKTRLWVQSAVSLFVDLPLSYESKIEAVAGIDQVCKFQWFGGFYQEPSNFLIQFGVDPDELQRCYPELEVVAGSLDAFAKNRIGCVVGEALLQRFGWSLGDKIPVMGTIFAKPDNSAWEFEIEAVYRPRTTALDANTFYFQFDYLDETLKSGSMSGMRGVGVYLLALKDGAVPEQVAADVDALFENGPQRVQATTEAEFSRQFVSMMGNVPLLMSAVGGAVLFAIFFAVLNTMLAAGRERVRAMGVLRALGFTGGFVVRLFVCEGLTLCAIGGALGLAGAVLLQNPIRYLAAGRIQDFTISPAIAGIGIAIALAVGTIAGLAPGIASRRTTAVEAMRAEG